MSEESSPPSLRLRPRNRDTAEIPAPSISPLVVPAEAGIENLDTDTSVQVTEPTPGRFRLKPISARTTNESQVVAPTSTEPVIQFDDTVSPAPALDEQSEPVRLKLKAPQPNSSVSEPAIVSVENTATDAETPADEVTASTRAPQPVENTLLYAAAPVPPPPVALRKPPVVIAKRRWSMPVIGLVVLLGGTACAGLCYLYFSDDAPPPAPAVRQVPAPQAPKSVAVAEPPPAVTPASPAQPTVAVVETKQPASAAPELTAIQPLAPLTAAVQPVAPAPVAVVKPPVAPVVTPAFRLWVEAVRINGVSVNADGKTRVIINGRLVRPGDTIDTIEGITYDSLDTEQKQVRFRDRKGAVAGKPY